MAFIEMDFASGGAESGKTVKCFSGVASVDFVGGKATFNHNFGFDSASDYNLLWNFEGNNIMAVRTHNVDGNTSEIYSINYSGSSIQSSWNGNNIPINYFAIEVIDE